jgi:hypothetical protein
MVNLYEILKMSDKDSPLDFLGSSGKKPKPSVAVPNPNVKSMEEALAKSRASQRQVAEMMNHMASLREAIDEKIELLSKKKGLTKDQMWEYISRKENFTREEWELLEKENKLLSDKVWAIVGRGDGVSTAPPPNKDQSGNRKGKYVGARRNWIPTR